MYKSKVFSRVCAHTGWKEGVLRHFWLLIYFVCKEYWSKLVAIVHNVYGYIKELIYRQMTVSSFQSLESILLGLKM